MACKDALALLLSEVSAALQGKTWKIWKRGTPPAAFRRLGSSVKCSEGPWPSDPALPKLPSCKASKRVGATGRALSGKLLMAWHRGNITIGVQSSTIFSFFADINFAFSFTTGTSNHPYNGQKSANIGKKAKRLNVDGKYWKYWNSFETRQVEGPQGEQGDLWLPGAALVKGQIIADQGIVPGREEHWRLDVTLHVVWCCVVYCYVAVCCVTLCHTMTCCDMLYDGKFYCGNEVLNSCIQCINAYRKCIDV